MAHRHRFTADEKETIRAMALTGSNLTACAKAIGRPAQSVSPYWHQIVDKPRITDPLRDRPIEDGLRERWRDELLPGMLERIKAAAEK